MIVFYNIPTKMSLKFSDNVFFAFMPLFYECVLIQGLKIETHTLGHCVFKIIWDITYINVIHLYINPKFIKTHTFNLYFPSFVITFLH